MACSRIYILSSVSGETGTLRYISSESISNSHRVTTSEIYSTNGDITNLSSTNAKIYDSESFHKGYKNYAINYEYPETTSSSSFFYSSKEPYISGESSDFIGESIKLNDDGKVLAVSSPSGNGLVRVFSSDGDYWEQLGADIEGAFPEGLGSSIDLNKEGDMLAIGVPFANLNSGLVKIYDWDNSSWIARDPSISGKSIENFGCSLSLSKDGDHIAIGGVSANLNSGISRVYNWVNGSWSEMGNGVSGISDEEHLGSAIDISTDGQTILVGGSGDDGGNGLVRSYHYSGAASSGLLGGLIFTSNEEDSSYNDFSISVSQIAGGTTAPNAPTPATVAYNPPANLIVSADINNGQATNSGVAINLSSPANSAELSSAGFSVSMASGLELDPIIPSGPTLTEGGIDPYWNQLGQTINGSNNEKFGSSVKMRDSHYFAAGGVEGNNGDGSIRAYKFHSTSTVNSWNLHQNLPSGKNFDLNTNFSILSVGHPEANLGSGLCRTYGYHSDWEPIGQDLMGESQDERFGKSVSLNSNGSFLCSSANLYGVNKGLVRVYDFDYIADLNLNSTRVTSEKLNLDYYKLPTFDPLVIGDVWRSEGDFLKISAGWSPAVINTLAWYDAADAFTITSSSNIISEVKDKSGNGLNLTVITPGRTGPKTGRRTLNGLNVIDWDEDRQFLENLNFSHDQASTPLFIAVVFKADVDGNQDFIFAGTTSSAIGDRMALRRFNTSNGFQILGGSGTGTNIAMGSGADTVLEGETYIILSKLNSSNSQIRIDGHFKNTGNIGTNHLNSIKLGGNAIGGSNLEGYVAEFIIFSDIGEQENIEGYLAHKWGLTSKLPADHTHKNNLAF